MHTVQCIDAYNLITGGYNEVTKFSNKEQHLDPLGNQEVEYEATSQPV